MGRTLSHKPELYNTAASEFTRPSNTTAYAAGDMVGATAGTIHTIAKAARYSGGGGRILVPRLHKSTSTTANGTFRIHFFNDSPTTANDNAAFALRYTERAMYIGFMDVVSVSDAAGAGAVATPAATTLPLFFKSAAGSSGNIYAVVTATAAYSPGSAETFSLTCTVERW